MIGGIKGKGNAGSLQYIYRMTRKTTVDITIDVDKSPDSGTASLDEPFVWNEVFSGIDADGDGIIGIHEFEDFLARKGEEESDTTDPLGSLLTLLGSEDSADNAKETTRSDASSSLTPQPEDSQAARIFKIIDTDSDGSITRDELLNARELFLKRMENAPARLKLELTEAFLNMLEVSGSIGPPGGPLATRDYPSVAQAGAGQRDRIYHKADANMDGEVSRDELEKALSQAREKRWRGS